MPAIVKFPTVVEEALKEFGRFFPNEPERKHFAEYLTGLIIANKKNVSAINRQFAAAADQSCLNRWITEVQWDEEAFNRKRLDWLQKSPDTRYSQQGVIAIDNTLIDHSGKYIEDVGYFWDHAEQRSKIAHDYIIANYVCTSNKHYPLEFYRFIKEEQCKKDGIEFVDHNKFVRWLIDWVVKNNVPGDFTFDSYFTSAATLNHINGYRRNYVGDMKFNRKIIFCGKEIKAEDLARQIAFEDRKPIMLNGSRQYYFTKSIRIPDVDHRVRIVILWDKRNDKEAKKMLVCNCTHWDITRILKVYRCRWTGTECFHRDGKQHLGNGSRLSRLCSPLHIHSKPFNFYNKSQKQFRLQSNWLSAYRQNNRSSMRPNDSAQRFLCFAGLSCGTSSNRLFRHRDKSKIHIFNEQLFTAGLDNSTSLQMPLADRNIFQMDKAISANQNIFWHKPECGQDSNLDCHKRLCFGSDCQERTGNRVEFGRNAANSQHCTFRESLDYTSTYEKCFAKWKFSIS